MDFDLVVKKDNDFTPKEWGVLGLNINGSFGNFLRNNYKNSIGILL